MAASNAVNVASGATLSGSGVVKGTVAVNGTLEGTLTTGAVSGSGLVSPGNSPGILASTSVDIGSGLAFAFEFTLANTTPHYDNATATGNDLLLLTSSTPFSGALTLGNTVSIYLSSTDGGIYLGGFFTSLSQAELEAAIKNANFEYFVVDANGSYSFNGTRYSVLDSACVSLTTTYVTDATFSDGTTAGSELKITVVPEPSTWVMLMSGIGLLAFGQGFRRRMV